MQKATKGLQVTASSNQRPSEFLASLLEYCPPGEEGTAFFRAAFTVRLPATFQVHLAGTKLTDLKELAQLADCLWQCNTPQPVAAIYWRRCSQRTRVVRWWPPCRPRSDSPTSTSRASRTSRQPAARLARSSSSASSTRGMGRTLWTVLTRRTAPGRETRWPGGGGRRLLWPQRPTSLAGGRGNPSAVSG